ncbi:hypothetical protein D3C84_384750 [compost metagenome]
MVQSVLLLVGIERFEHQYARNNPAYCQVHLTLFKNHVMSTVMADHNLHLLDTTGRHYKAQQPESHTAMQVTDAGQQHPECY